MRVAYKLAKVEITFMFLKEMDICFNERILMQLAAKWKKNTQKTVLYMWPLYN